MYNKIYDKKVLPFSTLKKIGSEGDKIDLSSNMRSIILHFFHIFLKMSTADLKVSLICFVLIISSCFFSFLAFVRIFFLLLLVEGIGEI